MTISTLELIEVLSLSWRVNNEIYLKKLLTEKVDHFGANPVTSERVDNLLETTKQLSNLPVNFSSTGIITDISTWICSIM